MPTGTSILALCGTDPGSGNWRLATGWGFPDRGPVTARRAHAGTPTQQGFRGLPWGVGDPAAAFLDSTRWAVVRIDDVNGPVPARATPGATSAIAAVEFDSGTVLYRGDRRGAIETLIQHGADRAAMSVGLALPDDRGVADVGPFGVAVAGDSGVVRGGANSQVLVPGGYGGIAVAGRGGHATVGGSNGIAAVGAGGNATASGLAIARDAGVWLSAGESGVAVAVTSACQLDVGVGGIAVGLDRVERISIGPHAIAVVRDATDSRIRVTLGQAALIAVRYFDSSVEALRFSVAHAGTGGLEPDVPYIWVNGAFHKRSEYVAQESEAASVHETQVAATSSPLAVEAGPGEILCPDTGNMVLASDDGWAIAGTDGTAVAGPGGLAKAGERAETGDGGIAITGGGTAHAGYRGVAICDDKRYGTAEAGDGGVAVGLGSRFGTITAGAAGAAIYGGAFGIVTAGDEGIAIGGFESSVSTGKNGIAISTGKCPSGKAGSLLVCRGPQGDFRSAVIDQAGEIPTEFLQWAMQFERQPESPSSA